MELAEIEADRDELRSKLTQAKADLKHAQKMNKELRQRASAEQQEKRYRDMADYITRLEQQNTELATEADELRADAERYRKLKAHRERGFVMMASLDKWEAAVDALKTMSE